MNTTRVQRSTGLGRHAFGPFILDAVTRRLWRDGRPVPLTSKTFDLLLVLVAHRDRVVSKDELLGLVWPDTAVNENNLARQVSSLRRVLGQRPDQHDFIVTVPGQGYRFVATIEDLPASDPGVTADGPARSAAERPLDSGDVSANGEWPWRETAVAALADREDVDASMPPADWRTSGIFIRTIWGVLAIAIATTALWTLRADQEPRRSLQRITFEACHPEPGMIRVALGALHLTDALEVTWGPEPQMLATLRTPRGLVSFGS